MFKNKSIEVAGTRVDMVQISEIVAVMNRWIMDKSYHNYIVVSNADTVVRSREDAAMRQAVNSSSLSIPDGISLVLLVRARGVPLKSRAYGPDLMLEFLKASEENGFSHFLYGATEETLEKLVSNIRKSYPKVRIAGSYAPPFRPLTQEEDAKVVDLINHCAPDVLWVGIGCPKQELWMYAHKNRLNVPVMAGVGAAFDFISGVKRQAPAWIRNNGFEWLFRLFCEPKRLWRRYLINNFKFLFYVSKELFSSKSSFCSRSKRQ